MEDNGIEIILYNHENGKSFYKRLTTYEFVQITSILNTKSPNAEINDTINNGGMKDELFKTKTNKCI